MADGRSQAISSVGQSQVEPKPSRRLVVSDLDAEVRVNVLKFLLLLGKQRWD